MKIADFQSLTSNYFSIAIPGICKILYLTSASIRRKWCSRKGRDSTRIKHHYPSPGKFFDRSIQW